MNFRALAALIGRGMPRGRRAATSIVLGAYDGSVKPTPITKAW
jgi:hypothetical protein